MSGLSRRAFLGGSVASVVALASSRAALGQAQPAASVVLPGAISANGVVSSGTSLAYQGANVSLRSGERYVISRAASQVAASGVTRAVANRTMGMIATRLLVPAAEVAAGAAGLAVSPWVLGVGALGLVAYGAYRYLTQDDEDQTNTTTTSYSVKYDANGAATISNAVLNNCQGLPSNAGGSYPNNVVLGAFNNSSGCQPAFRQKIVVQCTAAQRAGMVPVPAGWNTAFTYDNGYVDQAAGIKEWWVFLTRTFPAKTGGGYEPMEAPPMTQPARLPDSLPANIKAKPASKAVAADLSNAIWKQAVPASDSLALPWSAPNTIPATAPAPVPLPYSPPASPLPFPEMPPLEEFTKPLAPQFAPGTEIKFEFPPEIKFAGDTGTTPDPQPSPSPSSTGGTGGQGIDWGTPPTGEMPQAPDAFSWVPTPWATPNLPGSCQGIPYNFSSVLRGASGSINPCPYIDQARPIIRPVAVAGWTVYAVRQFLDL